MSHDPVVWLAKGVYNALAVSWCYIGVACVAQGYLAALSASAYSFVSMVQRFGPIMNPGGAAISLTYLASEKIIPGAKICLAGSAIVVFISFRCKDYATRQTGCSSTTSGLIATLLPLQYSVSLCTMAGGRVFGLQIQGMVEE